MITPEIIARARELLSGATQGAWVAGHLIDPLHDCQCAQVGSEGLLGAIATIHVNNGLPVSQGGNDAPPSAEAQANLELIVLLKNIAPDLLDGYSA